jgi:hypothetical protein
MDAMMDLSRAEEIDVRADVLIDIERRLDFGSRPFAETSAQLEIIV